MQKDQTDLSYRSFHFLFEYHQKEKKKKKTKTVQESACKKKNIIPPKPNKINPTTVCRKIMALTYKTQSCFLN